MFFFSVFFVILNLHHLALIKMHEARWRGDDKEGKKLLVHARVINIYIPS